MQLYVSHIENGDRAAPRHRVRGRRTRSAVLQGFKARWRGESSREPPSSHLITRSTQQQDEEQCFICRLRPTTSAEWLLVLSLRFLHSEDSKAGWGWAVRVCAHREEVNISRMCSRLWNCLLGLGKMQWQCQCVHACRYVIVSCVGMLIFGT